MSSSQARLVPAETNVLDCARPKQDMFHSYSTEKKKRIISIIINGETSRNNRLKKKQLNCKLPAKK